VRHGHWNFEDPEGVTQDVLLKLLRVARGGAYRGQSGIRTFVHSIARHTCVDAYRRERLRPVVESGNAGSLSDPASPDHPEDAAVRREERELLRYVYQRLPEECRRLWRWVYEAGLSAPEVGQRLGISAESVRARAHRCLEKARDIGRAFLEAPAGARREIDGG
jgi:RNA polymerase sigma-70 factor (ECF subfamily)